MVGITRAPIGGGLRVRERSRGRITVADVTAVGRASEKFGEAVESVFAASTKATVERQERQDNDWITEETSAGHRDWVLKVNNRMEQAPEGAEEFTPQIMAEFDEWLGKKVEEAPSVIAAEDFKLRAGKIGDYVFGRSVEFEAKAGRAAHSRKFNSAIDTYAAAAAADSGKAMDLIVTARGDLAAAEATWMLPTDVSVARDGIPRTIAGAAIESDIAKNPEAVIATINGSKSGDGSLAGFLSAAQRKDLKKKANAEINRRRAARSTVKTELNLDIGLVGGVVSAGFKPETQAVKDIDQRVSMLGDRKVAVRWADVKRQQSVQQELVTLGPSELQSWVNKARSATIGREVSPGEAGVITMAEDLLTEMNTTLNTDPLSWAPRAGQRVDPIEFVGDAAVQSMQTRRGQAVGFAEVYGIDARYMTNEEERELGALFDDSAAGQQAVILSNVVAAFGQESVKVFSRVSKDNVAMAHAGGLTMMGPLPARSAVELLNGLAAIKAGTDVLPPKTDINTWTAEHFDGAFAVSAKTRNAVIDAAKSIYTDRAVRSPVDGLDDQRVLWENALDSAVGGYQIDQPIGVNRLGSFAGFNGSGIVLPSGLTESRFTDLMGKVNDDDLALASVGGAAPVINDRNKTPLTADMLRAARLHPVGSGKYLVDLTHVAQDFVMGSGTGGRYVFDFSKIEKSLAARGRDAVVGLDVPQLDTSISP